MSIFKKIMMITKLDLFILPLVIYSVDWIFGPWYFASYQIFCFSKPQYHIVSLNSTENWLMVYKPEIQICKSRQQVWQQWLNNFKEIWKPKIPILCSSQLLWYRIQFTIGHRCRRVWLFEFHHSTQDTSQWQKHSPKHLFDITHEI